MLPKDINFIDYYVDDSQRLQKNDTNIKLYAWSGTRPNFNNCLLHYRMGDVKTDIKIMKTVR